MHFSAWDDLVRARGKGTNEALKHAMSEDQAETKPGSQETENGIICPVCGATAVPEKCKVIYHSEICRGRVILNCLES